MFFYRVLLLRECSGVAEGPETLLRDVTQKVADIEGRIALAVEVEVEQEEALAVHNDLVGVEVAVDAARRGLRSEEHTSELQSHSDLVCRLLLEKKKKKKKKENNKEKRNNNMCN